MMVIPQSCYGMLLACGWRTHLSSLLLLLVDVLLADGGGGGGGSALSQPM